MDKNKIINGEQLEQISGGFLVEDAANKKFWVARPDGTLLPAPTKEKAEEIAKQYSVSTDVMSAEAYKEKYGRYPG